jgi:hypothetical protein
MKCAACVIKSKDGQYAVMVTQLVEVARDVWRHELLGYYSESGAIIRAFKGNPVPLSCLSGELQSRLSPVMQLVKTVYKIGE